MITTLFLLRLFGALVLLAFLAVMGWYMIKDMRITAAMLEMQEKPQGQLHVVASESADLKVGTAFPLLPVTGIGRSLGNTIVLDDEYASGEHVLIMLRNSAGGWRIWGAATARC